MLQKLSIRNYALIDQLDIAFDKDLNIITGETGAGKSIIIGALSLILGQRAESRYFFNRDKKCIIEGVFKINALNLKQVFEDLEIDYEDETILRREISADGKSRAFINDSPVNLNILKQVTEKLIDIHSQHAVLEINDPGFQLLTIDSLADHDPALSAYATALKLHKNDRAALSELEAAQQRAASELDYHQFLFSELENAGIKADEQETIEQELEQLNNAEEIKGSLRESLHQISDNEYAALTSLKNAAARLGQAERFNKEIEGLNRRVQSTIIELKDISSELERLEQGISYDPVAAEKLTSRLDLIFSLQQKHRVTSNTALLEIIEQLSQKLLNYSTADEAIGALQKKIIAQKADLIGQAQKISLSREKVFPMVKEEITKTLRLTGIPSAALEINNEKSFPEEFGVNGIDNINFLFSANAGQAPAPLNKIASGGELSRFMLAVKSLISRHTALPTIIFDEIDTGISGDVALRVGNVMQELASKMQVITITHLPQIAGKGETHFYVYKEEEAARTTTGIKQLNGVERVEIIAEMLSGKNPGSSALQNARELLG